MSQESILILVLVGVCIASNFTVTAVLLHAVRTLRKANHHYPHTPLLNSEAPQSQSQIPMDNLSEVLQLHGGEWKHHCWVRDGSRDYQKAFDTPKVALRNASGVLELGRQ